MEAKLTELVNRLQAAAKANLKAVVLYGSAVTGEFREGHSDLNILCLVDHANSSDLEDLHGVAEWWVKKGNHPPLIFTRDELDRSADVFAIELLDMKSSHRILFGEDFLSTLAVPLNMHRLQVERELRTAWLRLRQAILAAPLDEKTHLGIMTKSLSTFCSLFRHALFALGQPMPANKREAIAGVASVTGADGAVFEALLDVREAKRAKVDVEPSLRAYLAFVEVVTNEIDRRLATP
jgi:predicted nucleotidyltransferase